MSAGFYKRRRGVLEHIENGHIDLLEDGIHDYLSLKANLLIGSPSSLPVGVCFTSAPAIHAHCPRVSERTVQRCLEHLEAIGWIKTWKVPGKRGNYPTLLCRASVHDLSGNEYRINGEATTDWRDPKYEPVGEVSGSCRHSAGTLSGLRDKRVESKKREKPRSLEALAHRPTPLLDEKREQEQRRKIEARDRRLAAQAEVSREAHAGENRYGVAVLAQAKTLPQEPTLSEAEFERRRQKQKNDLRAAGYVQ